MTHFQKPSDELVGIDPSSDFPAESSVPGSSVPDSSLPDPSARDKASEAADQGKQAVGEVASDVAERAVDVKNVATRQARDLVGEAREQLGKHAGMQQQNLVANLRALGQELATMTSASEASGVATELVGQAQTRVSDVAEWLDGREPQQMLDDVRTFARRRPGTFLLVAAATGVLTGRLTRGVAAVHADDDGEAGSATAAGPDGVGTGDVR